MTSNRKIINSLKAFAIHFVLSGCITLLIAALVFFVWFPYPYRELVGGTQLFFLIVAVDLVCGPFLTAVVFDIRKSKKELTSDISIIVLLQVAALAYGLFTLWQSRPVYLAFEVDRFRLVTYADIQRDALKPELNALHRLPMAGVEVIGTRESTGEEMLDSLELSLQGVDPSMRPDWWVPLTEVKEVISKRAYPISDLKKKRPEQLTLIQKELDGLGMPEESIVWLPMTSYRALDWIVLLNRETMKPVSFIHIDGF